MRVHLVLYLLLLRLGSLLPLPLAQVLVPMQLGQRGSSRLSDGVWVYLWIVA